MNFVPICKICGRYICNTARQHSLLICSNTNSYTLTCQQHFVRESICLSCWVSIYLLKQVPLCFLTLDAVCQQEPLYYCYLTSCRHLRHDISSTVFLFPCQCPLKSISNVLWKLFLPFLLQWWQPLLLTVSSSWSMVHSKTITHLPALATHPRSTQRNLISYSRKTIGKRFVVCSLGKMQTHVNWRVWETEPLKSSK